MCFLSPVCKVGISFSSPRIISLINDYQMNCSARGLKATGSFFLTGPVIVLSINSLCMYLLTSSLINSCSDGQRYTYLLCNVLLSITLPHLPFNHFLVPRLLTSCCSVLCSVVGVWSGAMQGPDTASPVHLQLSETGRATREWVGLPAHSSASDSQYICAKSSNHPMWPERFLSVIAAAGLTINNSMSRMFGR